MPAFFLAVAFLLVQERPVSEFLSALQVKETNPAEGELTFVDPQGRSRIVHEGDSLPEAGGATVHEIGRSTLVLKRTVTGADGEKGEALVVVRFDGSGWASMACGRPVPFGRRRPGRPPGKRRRSVELSSFERGFSVHVSTLTESLC